MTSPVGSASTTVRQRASRVAIHYELALYQVVTVTVDFGDVGGTGQDGLPVLGIGDAQFVEDANGVLVLVLWDAGEWRRGGLRSNGIVSAWDLTLKMMFLTYRPIFSDL